MQITKKLIFLKKLTLVVILFCQLSLSMANETTAHKNNEIKKKLTELINHYNIPGAVLSYGFYNNPITTIAVGYKDLTKKSLMETDTLFLCGSITKSFIAAIVLQLIDQNKLQLNESLENITKRYRYDHGNLTSFISRYPSLGPITIKQLLNHTSGIAEVINTLAFKQAFIRNPNQYWSENQLLELAMQHPIYFTPGTPGMWSYTNTDYILLSMAIQLITGQKIDKKICLLAKKANLSHTYFPKEAIIPVPALKKLSVGYLPMNSNHDLIKAFTNYPVLTIPGDKEIKAFELRSNYNVFLSLVSTTQDLANWYRSLFEKKLLSSQAINEMLSGVTNAYHNHAAYGLGVALHSFPSYGYVVSHDGLQPGYTSIVLYFKNLKLVIALATNSSNPYISTFNIYNGQVIPGFITQLLPLLI